MKCRIKKNRAIQTWEVQVALATVGDPPWDPDSQVVWAVCHHGTWQGCVDVVRRWDSG